MNTSVVTEDGLLSERLAKASIILCATRRKIIKRAVTLYLDNFTRERLDEEKKVLRAL